MKENQNTVYEFELTEEVINECLQLI